MQKDVCKHKTNQNQKEVCWHAYPSVLGYLFMLTMPLGTRLQDAIDTSLREKKWVKVPCNLSDEEICKANAKGCVITRADANIIIWNPGSFECLSEECKTRHHQD